MCYRCVCLLRNKENKYTAFVIKDNAGRIVALMLGEKQMVLFAEVECGVGLLVYDYWLLSGH